MVAHPQPARFLAVRAFRVHHVVPLVILLEKLRHDLRRVLQVGIHHDRHITGHVVQRRRDGCLMAEVSREGDDNDAVISPSRLFEHLERTIPASVVDEDDLVGSSR